MMFDDSSVVGGPNSSMLNTSMKSEGGLSMLNTSRGEEVANHSCHKYQLFKYCFGHNFQSVLYKLFLRRPQKVPTM